MLLKPPSAPSSGRGADVRNGIGDESAGVAAVVDPKLQIDEYLRLARYFGVRIEHILETHNHADHVSGHGRLVAATGAKIHVHRDAQPDYDHEPFDDGWELELGRLRVRAVHTPGHLGGYLTGGMTSWREEKNPVQRVERVDVKQLHERAEDDEQLQILDVRENGEWDAADLLAPTRRSRPAANARGGAESLTERRRLGGCASDLLSIHHVRGDLGAPLGWASGCGPGGREFESRRPPLLEPSQTADFRVAFAARAYRHGTQSRHRPSSRATSRHRIVFDSRGAEADHALSPETDMFRRSAP